VQIGSGLGGRGLVTWDCRRGGERPGVGDAEPTALDASGSACILVGEQGLPGSGGADPGAAGDDRDRRPGGFGRQGGQDGRCGAVASRRSNGGAGVGVVAVSAALRAACGAGDLVRAMMVTPFPILRALFPFRFDCAGVFWTTIALVTT
jgi:hypothetical protein